MNMSPETNDDLVYYCKSCHSLCIMVDDTMADEDWDGSYCNNCHSTDIGVCSMDEWLAVEESRRLKKEEIEWNR